MRRRVFRDLLQLAVVVQLEIERRQPADDVSLRIVNDHRRHDEDVLLTENQVARIGALFWFAGSGGLTGPWAIANPAASTPAIRFRMLILFWMPPQASPLLSYVFMLGAAV